ncbi:3-beta hydroxysteroid dehydrogenase/isomerase family-domain-containing protein [Cladochytrium replicatum]|nr:3-beta hydroxysteroid dehydrogenase/isomerase family-domain-containing protein [Cladochytrium replicatum]
MNVVVKAAAVTVGIPAAVVTLAFASYTVFKALYTIPSIPKDSHTFRSLHTPIVPAIPDDVDPAPTGTPTIYAIVGGGGFLGCYLVYRLLRTRKVVKIYVLDLAVGTNGWLFEGREEVQFVRVDITKRDDVERAVLESGSEVVFFTAALIRPHEFLPRDYAKSYKVNVEGVENVLRACEVAPLTKLFVFVSSATVCSGWDNFGQKWWDLTEEEAGVSQNHYGNYSKTKAIAERMVLAKDSHGVRTVALRPQTIYGYGDMGTFGVLLQSPPALPSFILSWEYVENVAEALIAAADGLRTTPDKVAGRAFFITDGWFTTHTKVAKAVKVLRPELRNVWELPRAVFFAVCLFGDILYRMRISTNLSLGLFGLIGLQYTYSSDAALDAIGDWRRWTPGEAIGRCLYFWGLHQNKLNAIAKKE